MGAARVRARIAASDNPISQFAFAGDKFTIADVARPIKAMAIS
jgi:hypothetical protein